MEFNIWRVNEDLLAEFKRVREECTIDWANHESKCKPKVQSTVKPKYKPITQDRWFARLVKTLKVNKN
jgi:hypothetical protein